MYNIMRSAFLAALVFLFALLQSTAADTPITFPFSNAIDGFAGDDTTKLGFTAGEPAVTADPPDLNTPAGVYYKMQCRGYAILKAMTLEEDPCKEALGWRYCQSIWSGNELTDWGYHVNDAEDLDDCEESIEALAWNGMKRAFEELQIDPKSTKDQGPTQCFYVKHFKGKILAMGGDQWYYHQATQTSYWNTGARLKIAVNANDGIIYFIDRTSPEEAAKTMWGVEKPEPEKLPRLRSSSDITWGLWSHMASNNLANINYFMVTFIVNTESVTNIVPAALKAKGVADGRPLEWPGTDFHVAEQDKELRKAFQALVGSPNALAAGYFLVQHRRQLGQKHIEKVRIWKEDKAYLKTIPNMLIYVKAGPPPEPPTDPAKEDEQQPTIQKRSGYDVDSRVVKRSKDGLNVLREHVFRARL